jgi:hypothetical protein
MGELQVDRHIRNLLAHEEVAAVVQCGGRGRRLGWEQPKPLIPLPDGTRPLENVLCDLPPIMPVYLHLLREQREVYLDFLGPTANFWHKLTYIVQREGPLYDRRGTGRQVFTKPDGTTITASDGAATFARSFNLAGHVPEIFCLIDGAKVGVACEDVMSALRLLLDDESTDLVVFARELSAVELQEESCRLKEGRPRYARINAAVGKVFEYPAMPKAIVGRKDWLALAGMYVARARRYITKTAGLRGRLMAAESVTSLFSGYAHHLKLAMTLHGYNGRNSGLRFVTYEPKWYTNGIKTGADVKAYPEWQAAGMFAYRQSAWRHHFHGLCWELFADLVRHPEKRRGRP